MRYNKLLAKAGTAAAIASMGILGFAGTAVAGEENNQTSDSNAGAANGNNVDTPVQAPVSVVCNAVAVLGVAEAEGCEGGSQAKIKDEAPAPQADEDDKSEKGVMDMAEDEEEKSDEAAALPVTGPGMVIPLVAAGALVVSGAGMLLSARRHTA